MSRYFLTRPAMADLEEIFNHIEQDRPEAARRVLRRLAATFEMLAANPDMGHVREDLTDKPVRFWPVYSFLIIYRPETAPLQIIRVLSGYREITAILRTEAGL